MPLDSTPERDRALARQIRHSGRRVQSSRQWVEQWVKSAEYKRLKRHRKIYSALEKALPSKHHRQKVRPMSITKGTLNLEVADSIVLHELRNHYHQTLVETMIAAGSGVSDVRYRLAKK